MNLKGEFNLTKAGRYALQIASIGQGILIVLLLLKAMQGVLDSGICITWHPALIAALPVIEAALGAATAFCCRRYSRLPMIAGWLFFPAMLLLLQYGEFFSLLLGSGFLLGLFASFPEGRIRALLFGALAGSGCLVSQLALPLSFFWLVWGISAAAAAISCTGRPLLWVLLSGGLLGLIFQFDLNLPERKITERFPAAAALPAVLLQNSEQPKILLIPPAGEKTQKRDFYWGPSPCRFSSLSPGSPTSLAELDHEGTYDLIVAEAPVGFTARGERKLIRELEAKLSPGGALVLPVRFRNSVSGSKRVETLPGSDGRFVIVRSFHVGGIDLEKLDRKLQKLQKKYGANDALEMVPGVFPALYFDSSGRGGPPRPAEVRKFSGFWAVAAGMLVLWCVAGLLARRTLRGRESYLLWENGLLCGGFAAVALDRLICGSLRVPNLWYWGFLLLFLLLWEIKFRDLTARLMLGAAILVQLLFLLPDRDFADGVWIIPAALAGMSAAAESGHLQGEGTLSLPMRNLVKFISFSVGLLIAFLAEKFFCNTLIPGLALATVLRLFQLLRY